MRRQNNSEKIEMNFKKVLYPLFHLFGVIHYAYAIFYDYTYVFPEEVKIRGFSYGGKFIYLTFWDTVSRENFVEKVKVHKKMISLLDRSVDFLLCRFSQ